MKNLLIVIAIVCTFCSCSTEEQNTYVLANNTPPLEYWAELTGGSPTELTWYTYYDTYYRILAVDIEVLNPELFPNETIQLKELYFTVGYSGGAFLGDCYIGHMGGGGYDNVYSDVQIITEYYNYYGNGISAKAHVYITYDNAVATNNINTTGMWGLYHYPKYIGLFCEVSYLDFLDPGYVTATLKDFKATGKAYFTDLVQSGLPIQGHNISVP